MKEHISLALGLHHQIERAKACLGRMMEPTLNDVDSVPLVRDIIYDVFPKPDNRNIFIMACILLYSPRVMLGSKSGVGLVSAIADALNTSGNSISHIKSTVMGRYEVEKRFAESVDYACALVKSKLAG